LQETADGAVERPAVVFAAWNLQIVHSFEKIRVVLGTLQAFLSGEVIGVVAGFVSKRKSGEVFQKISNDLKTIYKIDT
jgi:hypothetical protein